MSLPGSAPAGVITGTVTDGHGRPLAEVSVSLRDAPVPVPDIAALTGPDGSFALGAPSPGHYTVVATDPGGETAHASVELLTGGAAVDVRIVFQAAQTP
ncbi:MAG: carboxypeptidase-like regulatory domain-containing protein [Dermatophilaceae bacterium]|nr:carboxypeptidase-like regulatory domain-containing protein [Intrasporangiaceae bacterium]